MNSRNDILAIFRVMKGKEDKCYFHGLKNADDMSKCIDDLISFGVLMQMKPGVLTDKNMHVYQTTFIDEDRAEPYSIFARLK